MFQIKNNWKVILFILIVAFIDANVVSAQHINQSTLPVDRSKWTSADSAWVATLPPVTFQGVAKGREVEFFAENEKFKAAYFKNGIKFWNDFPNDKRKFDWFMQIVNFIPDFWENPDSAAKFRAKGKMGPFQIDTQAVSVWNKVYPSMRNEFMNSNQISDYDKINFTTYELQFYLQSLLNSQRRNGQKLDLKETKEVFSRAAKVYYSMDTSARLKELSSPLRSIDMIFRYQNDYSLTDEDLVTFANSFLNDTHYSIREWAAGRLSGIALKNTPISFSSISTTGKKIDVKDYRGKVVLLDFWATWCGVCISRMPAIKKVYDTYKDKGFEVISISIDPLVNKDKIEAIEHKIGADWPLLIIGGKDAKDIPNSLYRKIWKQYGLSSVPQLLLLDKNGLTVKVNGVLQQGDFEPLVRDLLKQPYSQNK